MYNQLNAINKKPEPFEYYTAKELWNDEHTSAHMLSYHLNESIDVSSRKAEFIDRSAKWIAVEFQINTETEIADFGCGPGLYATRLAKHRANVTGIDFSQRSIDYARQTAQQENLNINYIQQNYLDFQSSGQFDLVMMIMCDFCALSPEQRQTMLHKFHTLLKPGGSVLLDVYSLTAFNKRQEQAVYEKYLLNGFWSAKPYYGFLHCFKYESEKVMLDKYTIIEADRTRTVYNWLQYFSPQQLEQEFAQAGFSVKNFYGNVAGSPFDQQADEFAIIAVNM